MTGLIICEKQEEMYCGVGATNCLGDFCENKKVGEKVRAYIDRYIDFDSQLIALSPYSIYDAKELCSLLNKNGIETMLLLYCDTDEKPYEYTEEFIGYDVCAEDYYTSVLGMDYLTMSSEEIQYMDDEFTNDFPFFENISDEVRSEYANQLNEYGLFDSIDTAGEIEEYCNWLAAQYDDIFEGLGSFKTVKMFIVK